MFADHAPGANRWLLLVDVIPTVGYVPMVSSDLDHGWEILHDGQYALRPHTKHGGVLPLQRDEYDRLMAADAVGTWKISTKERG